MNSTRRKACHGLGGPARWNHEGSHRLAGNSIRPVPANASRRACNAGRVGVEVSLQDLGSSPSRRPPNCIVVSNIGSHQHTTYSPYDRYWACSHLRPSPVAVDGNARSASFGPCHRPGCGGAWRRGTSRYKVSGVSSGHHRFPRRCPDHLDVRSFSMWRASTAAWGGRLRRGRAPSGSSSSTSGMSPPPSGSTTTGATRRRMPTPRPGPKRTSARLGRRDLGDYVSPPSGWRRVCRGSSPPPATGGGHPCSRGGTLHVPVHDHQRRGLVRGRTTAPSGDRCPWDVDLDLAHRTPRARLIGARVPQGRAMATSSLAMSSQPTVAMMYCRPPTM